MSLWYAEYVILFSQHATLRPMSPAATYLDNQERLQYSVRAGPECQEFVKLCFYVRLCNILHFLELSWSEPFVENLSGLAI